MNARSRSLVTSYAAAALFAVISLSGGSANAMITVTSPKSTNSGTNYITLGAYDFFGQYRLGKCEDGVFAELLDSNGSPVILGSSPNLHDSVDFKIFQNGDDDVRRVPDAGMSCQFRNMVPLQSNGYYIQMELGGGNDYTPNFNLGGGMIVYGGPGNDGITINTTTVTTVAYGEDGCDTLATYGGDDILSGGNHDDRLNWAGAPFNRCDGGPGFDYCEVSTCGQNGGQMANCETYVPTFPHTPVCN